MGCGIPLRQLLERTESSGRVLSGQAMIHDERCEQRIDPGYRSLAICDCAERALAQALADREDSDNAWARRVTAVEDSEARLSCELKQAQEEIARMKVTIASDAHAATFQTLGQYRAALLKGEAKAYARQIVSGAKAIEERDALREEIARMTKERQRDALDGQAALDEANNEIVRLKAALAALCEQIDAAER
jgi:chromosome segregation ATPase